MFKCCQDHLLIRVYETRNLPEVKDLILGVLNGKELGLT